MSVKTDCIYSRFGRASWDEVRFNPEPVGVCDGELFKFHLRDSVVCERHLLQLFDVGVRRWVTAVVPRPAP